jgi:hypothetical protein
MVFKRHTKIILPARQRIETMGKSNYRYAIRKGKQGRAGAGIRCAPAEYDGHYALIPERPTSSLMPDLPGHVLS